MKRLLQVGAAASVRETVLQVGAGNIQVWRVGHLNDPVEDADERLNRLGELLEDNPILHDFHRLEFEGDSGPSPGLVLVDEPES